MTFTRTNVLKCFKFFVQKRNINKRKEIKKKEYIFECSKNINKIPF